MESPTIVERPPNHNHNHIEPEGGFFGDTDTSDEQYEDPWQELTARHPELANLRQSPWSTWGVRKRRGSAAGHERPNTDFSNDSRSRFFRDPFYENIPAEFREHIPNRWNQHFEEDNNQGHSQTAPRQEQHQEQATQSHIPQSSSTDKATQTLVDETDVGDSDKPKQSLPQYGLRNTVDLGQKTAAEPGQLDAESARNQRSMSAPPDGRFSSPQRPVQVNNSTNTNTSPMGTAQQTDQNSKQPAVRVIPIFVEGRDEPVINTKAETTANYTEPTRPTPPKDDDFFTNHEMPHGFPQQSQFGRGFNSPFKNFGNRPGGFGPSKVFQQQTNQPPQREPPQREPPQQTHTFKSQTHIPNKNAHEDAHKPANVNEPKQAEQPRQQSPQPPPQEPSRPIPQQPQINDAISKIQLIQKDVLELMTQVENFSGKTKKDKEYIYLDEMLTRNLLKLDDIETEGKENIRLARKEAIKCIQKCIAVLEAKAETATVNAKNNAAESQNDENSIENESQPPPVDNSQNQQKEKSPSIPREENMDTNEQPKKTSKFFGKKKRDKSKDNKTGASVQKMDVDKVQEQSDNNNAASETTDTPVKCTNNENGTAMEIDSVTSSQ